VTGVELSAHAEGTIVPVRAQPGARRDAIVGVHAGALRVAVTAAPERGKANEAIAAVLAEALGCRPSQVALLSGAASRQKRFLVVGLAPEQVRGRLADQAAGR
jgi:hypothetical protein